MNAAPPTTGPMGVLLPLPLPLFWADVLASGGLTSLLVALEDSVVLLVAASGATPSPTSVSAGVVGAGGVVTIVAPSVVESVGVGSTTASGAAHSQTWLPAKVGFSLQKRGLLVS